MTEASPAVLAVTVAWSSFALAFVFGAVVQRSNFCTMGSIADIVSFGDWNRMRQWILAMAVAIVGTNLLAWSGLIDTSKSLYTTPRFTWLAYLVGGFLFGFGMVLAGGCGTKTLVRIGGGSLKSLVAALVLGLVAYITLRGLLGVFRVNFIEQASAQLSTTQDLPALLGPLLGLAKSSAQLIFSLTLAALLLVFVFKDRSFFTFNNLLGGVAIGLIIVAIWYVSGHVGHMAENPETLEEAFVGTNSGRMESLSFVAPLAYTLDYLMLWSDKSKIITLGIAAVAGMVLGSAAYSLATRSFRWEGFRDTEDTGNYLVGGSLMGFGGVTALGCTIGQGLSGISTLAVGSILALAAIIGGAIAALKYQMWRADV